jgi:hypothetical protein
MFIRSSTAINDKLINLSKILSIAPTNDVSRGGSDFIDRWCIKVDIDKSDFNKNLQYIYIYNSKEHRDKAFDELCAFLNSNYKLRDFT